MRKLLIVLWLLVPVGMAAVHYYGPGRKWQEQDDVARLLREADALAAAGEHAAAIAKYDAALTKLPPERIAEIRRVRLAKNHSRLFVGGLPQACDDLEAMLDELTADPRAEPAMVKQTRQALAGAQYYMTWLLRLEGLPEAEWSPYIEGARQNYKVLAEESKDAAQAKQMKEDLDSSIRLARMDLSDLQALPLPAQ